MDNVERGKMPSIYVETLGCKINQYESACVLESFLQNGFQRSNDIKTADIIVINTCTVTNRSDYKSRNLIKKAENLKELNQAVKIIVTGCYSQRNKDEVISSGLVDLIVDNNQKDKIFSLVTSYKLQEISPPPPLLQSHNPYRDIQGKIDNLLMGGRMKDTSVLSSHSISQSEIGTTRGMQWVEAECFKEFSDLNTSSMGDRSRAFLKIQDGCDFYCSYCAVPFARGKPRSRSVDSTLKQVEYFSSTGYEEIVLSGVNLGLYSSDGHDLADLLYKLSEFDDLKRIRLSSLEPQLLTDKLLQAIDEIPKICRHFHIPLQSGSNELLKIHNRKYTVEDVERVVSKLQITNYLSLAQGVKSQILPPPTPPINVGGASLPINVGEGQKVSAIGFDVIVGLPGETEELFEETYKFLEKLDFTYLHVFIYSKRKGTIAASMKGQVNGKIAKERSKRLLELSQNKKKVFFEKLIENQIPLFAQKEGYDKEKKMWYGTSDRYVKVYVRVTSYKLQDKSYKIQDTRLPSISQSEIGTTKKLLPKSIFFDGVLCEEIE